MPSRPLRVSLIEDDVDLREEMVYGLSEVGFDARGFHDGPEFYRAQVSAPCDVAVIDVGLPGEDGFTIAAHLRSSSSVGIVMLTARGALEDRLHGLQQGADAYLVKPVQLLELSAILQSLGRRLAPGRPPATMPANQPPMSATPLRAEGSAGGFGSKSAGGLASPLDPMAAAATPGKWHLADAGWRLCDAEGRGISLTSTERAFMQCLMASRNTPVSRDDLITALGGDLFDFDPHRLDSLASRLRRKAADAGMTLTLRAIRGMGYVFHDLASPTTQAPPPY